MSNGYINSYSLAVSFVMVAAFVIGFSVVGSPKAEACAESCTCNIQSQCNFAGPPFNGYMGAEPRFGGSRSVLRGQYDGTPCGQVMYGPTSCYIGGGMTGNPEPYLYNCFDQIA